MHFKYLTAEDYTPAIQDGIHKLFGQLTTIKEPIPLKEVLERKNAAHILICEENGQMLGMATMTCYQVVSGYRGWIEDVVVDEAARGRGIGRALVSQLIALGQEKGLSELMLFTGEHRKPAITLYENLGFSRKASHLYLMKFP